MGDLENSISWVGLFENQSPDQIADLLMDGPLKGEALLKLEHIASQDGDNDKIDPGVETFKAAALFCSDTYVSSGNFSALLSGYTITKTGIESYWFNFRESYWDQNRALVAREYRLQRVDHAFTTVLNSLTPDQFDVLRGLAVFDRTDRILLRALPQIQENRSLTVLYPGAGRHVAPLLIAMNLIDRGTIDQAGYFYTEIEPAYIEEIKPILQKMQELGVIDSVVINPAILFQEGFEQTINIAYRGKPIQITYAINRSGESYYRLEYLAKADLVVLHDPGNNSLSQSYDLVSQMLLQRRKFLDERDQLLLMEGKARGNEKGSPTLPLTPYRIRGPYGHCNGERGIGEITDCIYRSAYLFSLADPSFEHLTREYTTIRGLSESLYDSSQESRGLFLVAP